MQLWECKISRTLNSLIILFRLLMSKLECFQWLFITRKKLPKTTNKPLSRNACVSIKNYRLEMCWYSWQVNNRFIKRQLCWSKHWWEYSYMKVNNKIRNKFRKIQVKHRKDTIFIASIPHCHCKSRRKSFGHPLQIAGNSWFQQISQKLQLRFQTSDMW